MTHVLGFSLINGGLLGFLGLASIPIIIYLINRQRHRRVPWAAMEFLLRAMKKNRKRLRLENLLLLIIRTLIVLLFVFGMLRPIMDSGPLPITAGSTRYEFYIVDASYSMGLEDGGRSLLFQAVDRAKRRVDKVLRPGDQVGLIVGGGFPEVMFSKPQTVSEQGNRLITDTLDRVELRYEPMDVAATLTQMLAWIEQGGNNFQWEVHFFTDVQRRDWLTTDGATEIGIRDGLARLEAQGSKIVVHDLGPERARNASVTSVQSLSPLLAIDMPTSFSATVVNPGRETLAGLELEFTVNGEVQASKTISLDPGVSQTVAFPYVFRSTGLARVEVRLRSDSLEVDNRRYQVVEVHEAVEVLVADGGSEADWLEAALVAESSEHSGIRLTPYRVETVPADRLISTDLSDTRVIVLANVEGFTEAESDRIGDYVRDGGGLLVFVGGRANMRSYNSHPFDNGKGWFPYALAEPPIYDETRKNYFRWTVTAVEHPAVEYLAAEKDSGLELLAVHGYWRPADTAAIPSEDILVRLNDVENTPAVVERRFGNGRVISVNMSADRSWSNFPVAPAFLVFLYETIPFLSTPSQTQRNLSIGEPFSRVVATDEYADRVVLFRPDGGGLPLSLEPRPDSKSFDLNVPGQESPGLFEIRYGNLEDGGTSRWIAVNADSAEGDLTAVPPSELKDFYPTVYVSERGAAAMSDEPLVASTGELWRSLFYAVLALLALESVLARVFSARGGRV